MAVERLRRVTCDRCNGEIDGKHHWPRIAVYEFMEGDQGSYPPPEGLPQRADLCRDCAGSLLTWWKWVEVR